jgi:hypothetical protein
MKPELPLLAERCQFRQGVGHSGADRTSGADNKKWSITLADVLLVLKFQLIHIDGLLPWDPMNRSSAETSHICGFL